MMEGGSGDPVTAAVNGCFAGVWQCELLCGLVCEEGQQRASKMWSRAPGCGKLSCHSWAEPCPQAAGGSHRECQKELLLKQRGQDGAKHAPRSSGRQRTDRTRRWCRAAEMWRGWRQGSWGGAGGCSPSSLLTRGLPSGSELDLCPWGPNPHGPGAARSPSGMARVSGKVTVGPKSSFWAADCRSPKCGEDRRHKEEEALVEGGEHGPCCR